MPSTPRETIEEKIKRHQPRCKHTNHGQRLCVGCAASAVVEYIEQAEHDLSSSKANAEEKENEAERLQTMLSMLNHEYHRDDSRLAIKRAETAEHERDEALTLLEAVLPFVSHPITGDCAIENETNGLLDTCGRADLLRRIEVLLERSGKPLAFLIPTAEETWRAEIRRLARTITTFQRNFKSLRAKRNTAVKALEELKNTKGGSKIPYCKPGKHTLAPMKRGATNRWCAVCGFFPLDDNGQPLTIEPSSK